MPKHNSYTMNVDYKRNYYSCGDFGHLAKNCRNQRFIKQGRKMKYEDSSNTSNLNRKESLVVFN